VTANPNQYGVKSCWEGRTDVGVCYRSQNAECDEISQQYSTIEKASKSQVLIMGDSNYPNIDWATFDCDRIAEPFLDLVQDCFLTQHVHVLTRINNILDLVLTSECGMVDEVQIKEHFTTSDHSIINSKNLSVYKCC